MERSGRPLDSESTSAVLADYARSGFDTFDMADHYGSAELITGALMARARRGVLRGGQPADLVHIDHDSLLAGLGVNRMDADGVEVP